MGVTLKLKLIQLGEYIDTYKKLKSSKIDTISDKQSMGLRLSSLKKRLSSLLSDINKFIRPSITKVTYKVNGQKIGILLANVDKDDINMYFELMSSIYNQNIEILEIENIPNFMSEDPL